MPLPYSSSGRIELTSDVNAQQIDSKVVKAIVDALTKKRARNVQQNGNQITFRAGVRIVDNLNLLLPITSGEISIFVEGTRIIIRYNIRFTEFFIFTLLLVFGGGFALGDLRSRGLAFLAIVWLVLFGINVLLALIRFPWFLRSSVTKALHLEPDSWMF